MVGHRWMTLLPPPGCVEAFQAFAPFGEEDGPPEEWLWPGFNSLDQVGGEEEPPAPPRIKEEQEPLWIGLEGGRELTGAPRKCAALCDPGLIPEITMHIKRGGSA